MYFRCRRPSRRRDDDCSRPACPRRRRVAASRPIDRATHWRRPFVAVEARVVALALDQHAFAGRAACHEEKHRPRDGRRLKKAAGLIERRAGLEGAAQEMLGRRTAAGEEGRERVQRVVEPQQPTARRASAHRRLVDRGREAAGRDGGQDAGEARPGDVQELAGRAALVDDLDQPAQARKRPVEGAAQHRSVGTLVGQRGAAEGIGAVQQPDARAGPGSGRWRRFRPGRAIPSGAATGGPGDRPAGPAGRRKGSQPRQASRRASACSRRRSAWAGSPRLAQIDRSGYYSIK